MANVLMYHADRILKAKALMTFDTDKIIAEVKDILIRYVKDMKKKQLGKGDKPLVYLVHAYA